MRGSAKKAEILTLEAAVKKYMHDGIVCAFSGFTAFNRNPVAFAWEAVRQGIRNLHVLDKHAGLCTWFLNTVGAIRIYETDWVGWGEMAGKLDLSVEKLYTSGKLILEEYSHGAMTMRFLAGAVGAPFIPYYAPLGSDLYNPAYDALGRAGLRNGSHPRIPSRKFIEMTDPFAGEGKVVLLPAANPELCILHVEKVGEKGTARWRGISTLDKEMAFASDRVVVIAEEIVPEARLREHPESNPIPYFVVDAIVEAPWGAFPSAVPYRYDYDAPFMRAMDRASRNEADLKDWMEEWVFGPRDWRALIDKLGEERLKGLRADPKTGYSTAVMRGKRPAPRMQAPLSVRRSGY